MQQAPAQLDNVRITLAGLSVFEINCILEGLQELPAKIANPLTKKISDQANMQLPQPPSAQDLAPPETVGEAPKPTA